jgi:hypothetical protein
MASISRIQELLSEDSIGSLKRAQVKEVVDFINSMNSLPLNKSMFLNPDNNSLDTIREAWKALLHDDGPIEERMEACNQKLFAFGKSAIQELISFYDPDTYPVMNRNANSGMRYFGYDIKAY